MRRGVGATIGAALLALALLCLVAPYAETDAQGVSRPSDLPATTNQPSPRTQPVPQPRSQPADSNSVPNRDQPTVPFRPQTPTQDNARDDGTTRDPVQPVDPLDVMRRTQDLSRPPPGGFVPTAPSTPSTSDTPGLSDQIKRLGTQVPPTQEKPPPLHTPGDNPIPHTPDHPPPYRPEEPPTYGHDDLKPCCGKIGTLITFPIITDPMEVPKEPDAPHDPAVGAFEVLLHNGAFFHNELDLTGPAPALPIRLSRHWHGKVDFQDGGLLGYGWDLIYNKRIVAKGHRRKPDDGLYQEIAGTDTPQLDYYDGTVHAESHTGTHSEEREVKNFDRVFRAYVTTYRAPPGIFHEIERYIVLGPVETHPFHGHPDIELTERIFYVLREKNGIRYVFNCRGQLIYILSRHDNNASTAQRVRVELQYGGKLNPLTQNRMLSKIIDPVNRVFQVDTTDIHTGQLFTNIDCGLKTGTLAAPRFKRVSGRGITVEYQYRNNDQDPILEAVVVTSPGVKQRWEYTYDDAHRLVTAKDPNESAKGTDGKVYLTNHYDGDGRVVAQEFGDIPFNIAYGDAAAAAGAAATGGMTVSAPSGGAGGVTVTDANGTERIYTLESAGPYKVVESSTVKAEDGRSWKTAFKHNGDTQVTKITYPRGNGIAYDYTPANKSVKLGPIRDWPEKDWTYESDLSRGNLIWTKHFGLKDDERIIATQTYEHLYNEIDSSTDPGDAVVKYEYKYELHGDRGEPVSIQHPPVEQPDGPPLKRLPAKYEHNFRGQITKVDMGDGRVTSFAFNPGSGHLDRVDRADGSFSTYQYDDRSNIKEEDGTRGRIITERDGRGLITKHVVDPDGDAVTTILAYNENGHVTETRLKVDDSFALGRHAPWPQNDNEMHKPGVIQPSYERVAKTEYDLLNRIVSETVTGGRDQAHKRYDYSPDGTVRQLHRSSLNGNDEYVVGYEYDPRGFVSAVVTLPLTAHETRQTITRDDNGNEEDVTDPGASAPVHKEYDGLDRVTLQRTPAGAVQHLVYDERGNVKHMSIEGPSGPEKESTTLYSADFATGTYGHRVRQSIDVLARGESEVTEWSYDRHARLASLKTPSGGVTNFTYDLGDRVKLTTDPLGDEVENVYDKPGHLKKAIHRIKERHYDPATGKMVESRVTRETQSFYTKLGRLDSVFGANDELQQEYLYNSEGNLRAVFTPGHGQIEYTYDGLGRRQSVRRPDGFEVTAYTPGGLVREFDTGTHYVRNEYDALGRILHETDVNSGQKNDFFYDKQGRLERTVDRNGTKVVNTYDASGLKREVEITPSGIGVDTQDGFFPGITGAKGETYEMDALGRVVLARTNIGAVVEMSYDGLGRVVSETQKYDGRSATLTRRYAEDLSSYEVTYPDIAGGVKVKRSYDVLGRTTGVELDNQTIGAYAYGGPDRLAIRVSGNRYLTRFDYDNRDRLTGLAVGLPLDTGRYQTLWSETAGYGKYDRIDTTGETWHPLGNQAARSTQTTLTHDNRGRLTRSLTQVAQYQGGVGGRTEPPRTEGASFSASGMLWSYGDDDGRLTGIGEWGGGGAETEVAAVRSDAYQYDPRGRVTSVTTTGRRDMVGKSVPTKSYGDFSDFVTQLSDTIADRQEFKYDNLGQLLADGRFVYSYDYRGRLTRVVDRWAPYNYSESITFIYDALGRRVASIPRRDRQPGGGLIKFGPDWTKTPQWYLYDGAHAIADVALPQEPEDPTAAPMKPEPQPSLLARYVDGAVPGERLRMDRRAEDKPGDDLATFYLHQDMEGAVRFATGLYQMLPFTIANAEPAGSAVATPGRPLGDAMMLAGTNIRVPYINGATRVDGFAGTSFREDMAEALVDYRSAWSYARKVDHDVLRQDRLALQNSLQAEAGLYIAIMAAPALAEVGGSAALHLVRNGYVASALRSAAVKGTASVVAGGSAAWWTGNSYSLGEATTDFASGAATGAIDGMVGNLGLGVAGQFAFDLAYNFTLNSAQSALRGVDFSDAVTDNARDAVIGTVKGFVVGRTIGALRTRMQTLGETVSRSLAKARGNAGRPAMRHSARPRRSSTSTMSTSPWVSSRTPGYRRNHSRCSSSRRASSAPWRRTGRTRRTSPR